MSLHRINSEINSLQQSIYSLNQQALQQRDDLKRLQTSLYHLNGCKEDFVRNVKLCLQPSLAANTWHGSTANKFDALRNDRLKGTYQSLVNTNLNQVMDRLQQQIEAIQQSLDSIQSSMSTKNTRLSTLYSHRREEMLS